MEGSFTATELSKLCFAALASKVQCGELCPRIPEVMAEIRRRVEKRFLVTSWCPTLPGLAVAIPLPRRLEREGSNHNIGEVEAPPHPNKRARSIKRIAYKLWLIRTVDLQRVAWHSGGLDPDANLFERVDTLKFLVNLDEIGDESLPNPSDLMEPCEIKFDWYKKGAVSGLKVAWHPTVLEVYLVYSPKVTTVLEVKKALSTGRGSVKVNPAECPAPLRVGTGIGSTPGPKRAPAVPTFYSVGVSVENGTLSLSTINSLACTLHPASTKSGLTLPLSLHWVSGAASYSKKGDVGLINRNANLLDSRQGLGLNSLGTSALPLNEDCVEPELKPLKELECPILVVQSDEGDLYLSLSGKYHVNTIPHLAIYQGLPRPLNLSISRKGNWDVEIALIREGVARTTRTLNLEAYLPPKGLRLPAIFQQVLYELGPFGTGLERLGQNLQAHARAYQTHAKSLATKGSPTATLRRLLVSGMVGPDICAFLAAPELKKYEAWVETYAKGAQKLKLEVRNSVLSPLEKVISQLSMLGTNFEACEERRGLRLACRCACGLSIRARQLCNLLELDRKQFTSLIRSIMDIASGLEGGEPALRIPPPDILALNFLDRANDAGPTLDLQRFFIASEGAREHLQPDLERASSLVEDLGLFDVQTFELQSGPIHGKDATLPQLYNSLLAALEGSKLTYSFKG